ncbi:MAG: peptidylprolyl isomerase [Acidobacteria bacterium]|nr:peptidylprolyl isomerase [Acidobacteriota bacterium]
MSTNVNPRVELKTSKGLVVIELDREHAPKTVDNFLAYVKSGFYDGTIFHRVIPGFMVQGGGFTSDMKQKATQPPIRNEAANGLKNLRGTVAMARTGQVDSATAQFFINLVDNGFLDHRDSTPGGFGYCVFGHVVEGMDVVDAIAATPTETKMVKDPHSGRQFPFRDVPTKTIVIESAKVLPNPPAEPAK